MDNPEKQTTNIGHKAQNEEIYLKEKTILKKDRRLFHIRTRYTNALLH
jgi:hypothetical protein